MPHRHSDSYEDLSFPEISPELWSQLCHEEPEASSPTPTAAIKQESLSHTPLEPVETSQSGGGNAENYEEESDSSLWEQFPSVQLEDLQDIESEVQTQIQEPVNKAISSPPLYRILDNLFDEVDGGDIEEGGMNVLSARSLIKRYKQKGALSVTNLLQPLWCEYKAYYNLVSQERRGIEKRAKKFEVTRKVMVDDQVVEKTIVIEVDQAAMWRVEQHKVRGLKIHEKLEREVVPVKVEVPTNTREEFWARRILDMITGLVALKEQHTWREFPVFGFIQDIPVNGIIDELRLEPAPNSERGNLLWVSDIKTKLMNARLDRDLPKEYKVQLMLYKHMLDGLLVPNYDWTDLFKIYRIEPLNTFGDAFLASYLQLVELNGLGEEAKHVNDLEGLTRLWEGYVKDLNLLHGAAEPELRVEYRMAVPSLPILDVVSQAFASPDSGESAIVSRQTFEYDEDFLQDAIRQSLEFWLGTRTQIGVSVDETWKCDICEYRADCEWRAEQASIHSQKTARKK